MAATPLAADGMLGARAHVLADSSASTITSPTTARTSVQGGSSPESRSLGGPDGITLDSLRKLQSFFGASKSLNERQFVDKLGGVLGRNLSKQKLTHLFMKIDVNSDGTVDWDEFTNFMFLDKKESAAERVDLSGERCAARFTTCVG